MARLPRLCVPGWPHLVQQRGHNGQPAFVDDEDRLQFKRLLQDAANQHGLRIHAYGLRDDEVRLLVTPPEADSLSKAMQGIGRRYVAAFNRRHGRTGALWEGRFRTTVIEPARHLLDCMQYVEVGAGGATPGPEIPLWSSAAHHLGTRPDALVSEPDAYWALGNTPFDREAAYSSRVERGLTSGQLEAIHQALKSGFALGDTGFVSNIGALTPRRVVPLSRGRPKKST